MPLCLTLMAGLAVLSAADHSGGAPRPVMRARTALVVVAPHPDDESIVAGGTIRRGLDDPRTFVRAIYLSGGDRATLSGPCHGIPEATKIRRVVRLREHETRAAWRVLAPRRRVPIAFLRGPDQGLVASSEMIGGMRQDVLSAAGALAVDRAARLGTHVPRSVSSVLLITASRYDAHGDHRAAYYAARRAAETLSQHRGLAVRLWTFIIHDEIGTPDVPACCIGDLHWPAPGPRHDYLDLTDSPARPIPPLWDRVEDVSEVAAVRRKALAQHVSQVVGYPPLCMLVFIPDFYVRWDEKIEEPFYEEVF